MDARELTKRYYDLNNTVFELKKEVEYLTQKAAKLRMIVEYLKIDVKMLERR